ncbi:tetratricopeptide repeat protein [Sinorhizobium sp. B11]
METENLEILSSKVDDLSKRLDNLDQSLQKNEQTWYKHVPTFISIAALLFSFGTTYVSYKHTTEQDIQNLRTELRGMLQRLVALPKENLEAFKKYKDDPLAFGLVSGFIAQENNLLSKQAEDTISRLPAYRISPTDYFAVATALTNSRYYDLAMKLLAKALEAANGLDDEVGSLRNLANLMFLTGRVGDGRATYQKALDIFAKYKGFDNFTEASTNALTEINWAMSEASTNSFDIARQHLERADQIALTLPLGAGSELLKSQVSQARNQIFSGASLPTVVTVPAMALTPTQGSKP